MGHIDLIVQQNGYFNLENRLLFAQKAFNITANYELIISKYFDNLLNVGMPTSFKKGILQSEKLRYGENPHQKGVYYGDLNDLFEQLNGKKLSYNNLLDVDAAINLMNEFKDPSFGILKHNNSCGFAS